jgi:hypothetical protein
MWYGLICPPHHSPILNLQITNTVSTPEIAFTGDTTSDFILDPDNADVLGAKILVVEVFFLSLVALHLCFQFATCDKFSMSLTASIATLLRNVFHFYCCMFYFL